MGSYVQRDFSLRLGDYNISRTLGFLSATATLSSLPTYYKPWDVIAPRLFSLISGKTLRSAVGDLPLLDASHLMTKEELHRAFVILSFLVHAYVWCDGAERPESNIPDVLGEPFLHVCDRLGVEETLSYAGLCLWNWGLKEGEQVNTDSQVEDGTNEHVTTRANVDDALKNMPQLTCYLNFTGTRDEEVFYLVPVMIEVEGGKLMGLLLDAMAAASEQNDSLTVVEALKETAATLERMGSLMKLLHECDPKVFYHQLRPFLLGAKGMEDKGMPDGVVFHRSDGTKKSVKAVGGSAAQSSLFPFLDLVLGVTHEPLGGAQRETVFQEMKAYMPAEHRQFLDDVAKLPSLRSFVDSKGDDKALVEAYNTSLQQLAAWRSKHIGAVTTHIVTPARKSKPACTRPEPEEVKERLSVKDESQLQGTGGSALIPFLKQAKMDTINAYK